MAVIRQPDGSEMGKPCRQRPAQPLLDRLDLLCDFTRSGLIARRHRFVQLLERRQIPRILTL
ncbi:hypothetical protein D3C71_1910950 [compost metagenome]